MSIQERQARIEERRGRTPIDPEQNFRQWKSAVGLSDAFPTIRQLMWDELPDIQFGPHQDEAATEVFRHALSPEQNPQTVVLVNPGQGATTLARHIFHRLTTTGRRDAVDRLIDPRDENRVNPTPAEANRVIPVFVEVASLQGSVQEGIHEKAREAIVRSLAERDWDYTIPQARAIGAVAADIRPDVQRGYLKGALSYVDHDKPRPVDWDRVKAIAPDLVTTPIDDLIVMLRKDLKLTPVFLIDLSGFSGKVDDVVGVMKDLEEGPGYRLQERIDPIGVAYFASSDTHQRMQAVYSRFRAVVRYPSVKGIDVFRMLMDQNPRDVASKEPVGMNPASIVQSSIMGDVRKAISREGKILEDMRIDEVVARFRQQILRRMNKRWDEISFHLK